MTFSHCKGN